MGGKSCLVYGRKMVKTMGKSPSIQSQVAILTGLVKTDTHTLSPKMPSPTAVLSAPISSPIPRDPHKDPWYPYSNGTHFNGNIAMVLIFVFCALVCAIAVNAAIRFMVRHTREEQGQEEQEQEQPHPQKLTNSSLPPNISFPTLVFSSGTKMKLAGAGAEAAECAICLSEFVDGDGVRILPKCKHGFHVKCIEGWLSSQVSCPTCRTTCIITSSSSMEDEHHDVESPAPVQALQRAVDRSST
ncbi:hypothetical protein IFM89_037861 [Coptis chinensis]|uniref:RING-type domain-containing protein n=1 Tax=Coptis chinensis TaxID=261450 RepID=A0A835LQJ8_9MAGN|nr:hypothetical protein IFM89_037861 [Coptis chinensis]